MGMGMAMAVAGLEWEFFKEVLVEDFKDLVFCCMCRGERSEEAKKVY